MQRNCIFQNLLNFNSRPHGGRLSVHLRLYASTVFQLTPSRRATISCQILRCLCAISTHALTEGDWRIHESRKRGCISTHALTEGDKRAFADLHVECISTHALTEGDICRRCSKNFFGISTHALTEGDGYFSFFIFCNKISTHALTEGDDALPSIPPVTSISTHALTEGDGQTYNLRGTLKGAFQLTPSRRATTYIVRRIRRSCISTHALTEGDSQQRIIFSQVTYFNSRPHGGRQGLFMAYVRNKKFQLTPSRRATTHGLLLGMERVFQLTPSRRATKMISRNTGSTEISTHALTEGDLELLKELSSNEISTHALTEGDHAADSVNNFFEISTHALTEGDL